MSSVETNLLKNGNTLGFCLHFKVLLLLLVLQRFLPVQLKLFLEQRKVVIINNNIQQIKLLR